MTICLSDVLCLGYLFSFGTYSGSSVCFVDEIVCKRLKGFELPVYVQWQE